MKRSLLLLPLLLFGVSATLTAGTPSKKTAKYILSLPSQYEGKEVQLDVAMVKPIHRKIRVSELAFFHAMTYDKANKSPGGEILVAILASDAEKFVKKYGLDREGKKNPDTTLLKGTFMTMPGGLGKRGGPDGRCGPLGRIWFVDTTGKAAELIKANKLSMDDDAPNCPQTEGNSTTATPTPTPTPTPAQ